MVLQTTNVTRFVTSMNGEALARIKRGRGIIDREILRLIQLDRKITKEEMGQWKQWLLYLLMSTESVQARG